MANYQITSALLDRVEQLTAERRTTLSDLVRFALATYGTVSVPTTVYKSVRLSIEERSKLARIADNSGTSASRALALLLERAVDDLAHVPTPQRPYSTWQVADKVKTPGPRAYASWARLILDSADDATRPYQDSSTSWISSTIDQAIRCLQPDDVDAMRATIRVKLVELNQRNLLVLSRCDIPALFSIDLVRDSELCHSVATWHFVARPGNR